jgi:hypothetical protein
MNYEDWVQTSPAGSDTRVFRPASDLVAMTERDQEKAATARKVFAWGAAAAGGLILLKVVL